MNRLLWAVRAALAVASTCALLRPAALMGQNTQAGGARAREPLPGLGANASLHGRAVFPPDNAWNTPVAGMPVDPNSDRLVASIGSNTSLHPDFGTTINGVPNGIPYVVVSGLQPREPVTFEYADESDHEYYPVPPDAPIEGGPESKGDRHILILDRDNWKLFELFSVRREGTGKNAFWRAGSGAVWDLRSNALRPAGWTSGDAAGLPIFPGLARYEEVAAGEIRHALRFTVRKSRRAYVFPARHWASASSDPSLPPMGMRVRLKAGYDISKFGPQAQVVLRALKLYGMILADNGSDWFVNGAPDPRWSDEDLATMKRVKGSDFEVVRMGHIVTG